MTEPTNEAQTFIDRQLAFNKDVLKAVSGVDQAIRVQAKLNLALNEQLRDQDNRIITHRQLIIALTTMTLVSIMTAAVGLFT